MEPIHSVFAAKSQIAALSVKFVLALASFVEESMPIPISVCWRQLAKPGLLEDTEGESRKIFRTFLKNTGGASLGILVREANYLAGMA